MPEETTTPRTLVIDRPFGLVFVRALLLILVAWGVLEGLTRVGVGLGLLPKPRIGSVNAELDSKLILLEDYVQQRGPVDCLFLGSSQLDQAVNPAVFEEKLTALTGEHLTCFNFSLGTMTASPAGTVAEFLVRRYHPRILFVGLSARDFSDDFGELTRPLIEDPWVRYGLGEFSLGGWLTENSLFYRELLTLRSDINPDYMTLYNRLARQLTANGYQRVSGNDLSNPKKNFIPNFKLSKEDMAGVDRILALDSPDTQIVFVEVPVHYSFIPYYVQADPAAYRSLFVEPISAYFASAKAPFWQTQEQMKALVPDSGWNDVKHFNTTGAPIFSTWLAERTARAIADHEIVLPGD